MGLKSSFPLRRGKYVMDQTTALASLSRLVDALDAFLDDIEPAFAPVEDQRDDR